MNKKTIKKALLLTVCAILLVVASVMGTLAYLTSQDTVTNTFTAGKVKITLDESKVDEYGVKDTAAARVRQNAYLLVPGHAYTKDPIVHVVGGSESSFLYVKVENNIAGIEQDDPAYNTIEKQIIANGWTKLTGVTGVDNVYYRNYYKNAADQDFQVFEGFTVEETLDHDDLPDSAVTVNVTAYAVQVDGFADEIEAWNGLQAQLERNAANP